MQALSDQVAVVTGGARGIGRGAAGEGRIIVDLPNSQIGVDVRQQGQKIVVDFLKTSLPEVLRRQFLEDRADWPDLAEVVAASVPAIVGVAAATPGATPAAVTAPVWRTDDGRGPLALGALLAATGARQVLGVEQLDDGRETLVAGPLLEAQLVDDGRRSPRCGALGRCGSRFCHERQRSEETVTCL